MPLYKKPEHRAVTAPGIKLRKPNAPICHVDHINPPIETAAAPMYGPSIIPISGAMTVASVMNFPTAPMMGKSDADERAR